MLGPLWVEAFRYHRWANLHLLAVCEKLSDEQLQLTAPGTYGPIVDTLTHMLAAEQRYLSRLGGRSPQINERSASTGVSALTRLASRTGDELIAMAQRIQPEDEVTAPFRDGRYRLSPGIVLLQALHHGNDHRTHVCTVLGHHGLEYGDMDVWAYGDAIGAVVRLDEG